MATRYYPTTQVPNTVIDGPAAGTWARQSAFSSSWYRTQWTWLLNTSKTNGGQQQAFLFKTNQQGNYDMLLWRSMTKPLQAQTISGTVDLCFFVGAEWLDAVLPPANSSVVRYKLHIYITVGQTAAVRSTLLNNYVDANNFPDKSSLLQHWQSLAAAQTLTSQTTTAGDSIMVELGVRVVSSPTPAPTYPPTNFTNFSCVGAGPTDSSNVALADAVAGGTVYTTKNAWIEFSANITEQAGPAAPANGSCATAAVIASLPFTSSPIDTTASPDANRAVWWSWTAPTSGNVLFTGFGSNYGQEIEVFTGGCGVLTPLATVIYGESTLSSHRSQAFVLFPAVATTAYLIRVRNVLIGVSSFQAPNSGGICVLNGTYVDAAPLADDIYIPNHNSIYKYRNKKLIAIRPEGEIVTGVAIDYSKVPMDDLNGGINSNERLLVGLHNFNLVEIFDLPTLNIGIGLTEVDFIDNPFEFGDFAHVAQLAVNNAGLLYTGWFGNGYLFVTGTGTLPAILNTIPNNVDYSAIKRIPASNGDDQAAAPFTATLYNLIAEVTSPWAIALDAVNGILYYTSGGFYEPVGGTKIKKFNVNTNTQLADFATVSLHGTNNPGLKGIQLLSDGGLLVCNGTVVERYSNAGALVTTYTPSIPNDAQNLLSVRLTSTSDSFWVVDLASTRFFKFDLASGAELDNFQPYLEPGSQCQIDIYSSGSVTPPNPPPPPAQLSGIYQIVPGKTNDTLWADLDPETRIDVKIPDPFAKTALLGD